MILTRVIVIGLIVSTVMATVVWLRYRQQVAGRMFIVTVAVQILLALSSEVRRSAENPRQLIIASTLSWVLLALLSLSLLLFFASLYAPEWWQRRQTLGWIALPYLLIAAFIVLNNLFGTGLLITSVREADGSYFVNPGSIGVWMGPVFTLAWIPHVVLLMRTFMYKPEERGPIIVLIGLLVASGIVGHAMRANPTLLQFAGLFDQVILIGALAYIVIRRRVFETTQVVMDQALAGMAEGIAVLSPDRTAAFINPAIEQHLGLKQGRSIETIRSHGFEVGTLQGLLGSERLEAILETREQAISVTVSPIVDPKGGAQGHLLLSRDVTQARIYEQTLQQRQTELLQTIEELQRAQESQQALTEAIRSLSLPIIPVADGVIVMPLIGALDEHRAADFEQRFLRGIQERQAHTVVLDLTGVPPIDQIAASILMRTVAGAKLLGAKTILVGIRPEIAQSIVALGIQRSGFTTALTLQEALNTLLHQSARPANGKIRAV